jgi:tetratricopeptide (TPR) repeat protein
VHRDLKPANVLRDAQGRSFLTDFAATPAAGGGTLPSMSPQQLDGAAPVPGDDIYGFGALLYELIAGAPLFHPQVTAERIRTVQPASPETDLAGEPLPAALRGLLEALLRKTPAERPPGMGAVRDALEQILLAGAEQTVRGAAKLIRPVQRERSGAPAGDSPVVPGERRGAGLPASVVFAALAVLAVLAAIVVFYLPIMVRKRAPAAPEIAVAQVADAPAAAAEREPATVSQAAFDEALGAFLRRDDELRALNAELWAGADWLELRRLADAGDAAYRRRDTAQALQNYRDAAALADRLLSQAPAVLTEALREGGAALDAGDQPRAIASFERALALEGGNEAARRGLERARNLDRLLALMAAAGTAEAAGDRTGALESYRQAVALDPAAGEPRAAVTRLERQVAADAYEERMARGFAAQARGDRAAARAAFAAALAVRPGDPQARSALSQVEADAELERLMGLQRQAEALEREERWAEALALYQSALAADPKLAMAQQGAERARNREQLDRRLREEIGRAERFNDDAVLAGARTTLGMAAAVAAPGPRLSAQVGELQRLIERAVIPVNVTLESDNLTEVTVFKVGRLGAFSSRSLQLRPGLYTAVGSRAGYRDVRRSFRVEPGSEATPVVIRCEETI